MKKEDKGKWRRKKKKKDKKKIELKWVELEEEFLVSDPGLVPRQLDFTGVVFELQDFTGRFSGDELNGFEKQLSL